VGPEVLIFMVSINCQVDFDSDFWSGFDAAMAEEWSINATTACHDVEEFPSTLYEYNDLAGELVESETAVAGVIDVTAYIDAILNQEAPTEQIVFLTKYSEQVFQKPLASGVAYPTENLAFVENNFGYSTAAASHEILHLVLEEEGYEKECYSDMVHENQFRYELKEMGGSKHAVLKKFDC
jgi:hypothetical protein